MGVSLERGSLLHKRYRIVEILGQGGMGSVYRAVDENLGVDVAVKENLFTTDEYARQFRLEAVILANLRHTNLPRVTDHFVISDQGQYLIMDYIDGEDLRQRMERVGTISDEEAILVGAAMADALQYLHTRKPVIIHRDIKPGNVRISKDGHIYLVDFGLAKLVKGSQATTTGARAMTPGYSPPEQYGTARTDPRTDIYSLGATLYAALTGVIPEDGLARAMDNVDLTPLRKHNPKVSRKLAIAIEKALAVRSEDRFQSAEEFKLALLTSSVKTQRLEGDITVEPSPQKEGDDGENKNLASELPEPGGNDPISRPPTKPGRGPHSTSWWVFFSFFLLTILMALVSLLVFWSPLTKPFRALLPSSSAPGSIVSVVDDTQASRSPLPATATLKPSSTPKSSPTVTRVFTRTKTPTVTPTPGPTLFAGSSGEIAFVSDRTGYPQIYLMNADGSDPRQISKLPKGACQPSWSPDGLRIVFTSPCPGRRDQYPDANLYIINADGTSQVELTSGSSGDFDPAWSPDGTRIAFTSLRDGSPQIYLLNLADLKTKTLTSLSSDLTMPDWSTQPTWSPSGKQIIYTGHSRLTGALQIWIMTDAGAGQSQFIHRGDVLWNFLADWSPDGKNILFSETNGDQALGWLMRFDSENPAVVSVHLRTGGSYGTHGEYSPDGIWVVYESTDSENSAIVNYDIYLIEADGTGPIIRLTTGKSMEFDPAWRP